MNKKSRIILTALFALIELSLGVILLINISAHVSKEDSKVVICGMIPFVVISCGIFYAHLKENYSDEFHSPKFLTDTHINKFKSIKFLGVFCSNCNVEFKSNDPLKELPCGCRFHDVCIRKSLKEKNKCPKCKEKFCVDVN